MSDCPTWLPELLPFDDAGGGWNEYCETLYSIFHRDFLNSQPQLDGEWIRCRRDPLHDGKEAGFWHCIQEGVNEEARTPDLRRCERIAWIRAVIENVDDDDVDRWSTKRGSDSRTLIWYREEYLIVLGDRVSKKGRKYKQLITAYCTHRAHTVTKLRKELERCKNG